MNERVDCELLFLGCATIVVQVSLVASSISQSKLLLCSNNINSTGTSYSSLIKSSDLEDGVTWGEVMCRKCYTCVGLRIKRQGAQQNNFTHV